MRALLPIAAALAVAAFSCLWPAESGGTVVTLADYFELGEKQVELALATEGPTELHISSAVAERCESALVRVRIHFDFRGGGYSTRHATGALVDGGRHVATVAHELEGLTERTDTKVEILLGDGTVLGGRMCAIGHYASGREESDWAYLEVLDPPEGLASLEIGDADSGERLVLGFPGRHGRDASGRVVLDDVSASRPLRPLRILCSASDDSELQLDLTAGCVPIQGISGAPVVDAQGRIVSIQRGVTERFEDGRSVTTLNVVPTRALRSALERSAK